MTFMGDVIRFLRQSYFFDYSSIDFVIYTCTAVAEVFKLQK